MELLTSYTKTKEHVIGVFFGEPKKETVTHIFGSTGVIYITDAHDNTISLDLKTILPPTINIKLFKSDTDDDHIWYEITKGASSVRVLFDFTASIAGAKITIDGTAYSPSTVRIFVSKVAGKVAGGDLVVAGKKVGVRRINQHGDIENAIDFNWEDSPAGIWNGNNVSWDVDSNFHIDPSTVATTTTSDVQFTPHAKKTFYAVGLHWVFYSDATNAVWKTSSDGAVWSAATIMRASVQGVYFSVWFDGTYVHYVYANPAAMNQPVYYRRGTPVSDGTITWSAVEQTVVAGVAGKYHYYPNVCVDSAGYPWVSYWRSEDNTVYVSAATTNDGTWGGTAAGFPYALRAGYVTPGSTSLVPLTTQRMLVVYTRYTTLVYTRAWDGAAWLAERVSTSTTSDDGAHGVAIGDNAVIVFCQSVSNDIIAMDYTYATNTLGAEVTVVASASVPSLSYHSPGKLYCFWSSTATDHIYYRKRLATTWDGVTTNWIDESVDQLPARMYSAAYRSYNNKTGVVYLSKLASPFNVRYGYLNFPGVALANATGRLISGNII